MDAPYHYGWREGAPRPPTIDEIPLSWFYGDGVLLDFSEQTEEGLPPISRRDLEQKLEEIGYTLKKDDIVLIATGADKLLGSRDYFIRYRAVSKEAVDWLVEQGIRVIGTDTFSFDPPFVQMLREYSRDHDPAALWPAHFTGRDKPYLQIERLTNLQALPQAFGFKLSCFPIKLKGADAAWSRVVAMFE